MLLVLGAVACGGTAFAWTSQVTPPSGTDECGSALAPSEDFAGEFSCTAALTDRRLIAVAFTMIAVALLAAGAALRVPPEVWKRMRVDRGQRVPRGPHF